MLVSIILPTFNRGYCLARAINTVLTQSCPNWELIVVDDGSTDNTASLLTHFTDPRIRVLRNAVNKGVAAARNVGISAARSEWIAFIDSDDTWNPEKLAKQLEISRRVPAVSVIFTDLIWRKGDVLVASFVRTLPVFSQLLKEQSKNEPYLVIPRRTMYLILLEELPVKPSTLLVHKEVIERVGGFQESLLSGEDWEFLIRVARCYDFVYIDEVLAELTVLPDATHIRYAIEDKKRFIALLRHERESLKGDSTASAAARRGIIWLRKHLYWHYMSAGDWRRAAVCCLRGFWETRDLGLLLRAAWAFQPALVTAAERSLTPRIFGTGSDTQKNQV